MDCTHSNFISSPCSTSSSPYPSASCAYPRHEDASMLSVSEWKELYPSDQYKNRSSFALHFLFALGQPLKTITNYIAALKEKNPERLIQGDAENHSLTPLHIAAMKANAEGAKALLGAFGTKQEKLAAIRKEDDFGWTPLHHAACTCNTLFQLFIAEGGDPQTKTSKAPSPKDLRSFSGREVTVNSSASLFALVGEPKSLIPVAALNLKERTSLFGASFVHTDHPIYPSGHLKALWQPSVNEDYEATWKFLSQKHAEFKANRPSLIIQECKELSGVVPSSLELVANQYIPEMSIVTEYAGLIADTLYPNSFLESFNEEVIQSGEYVCDGVDGRLAGNEAKFANMGFPNCTVRSKVIDGVQRKFLISLRPIKKGEAILWSYGPSMYPLVLGRQILLGKEEMETFYRKHQDIPSETLKAKTHMEAKARRKHFEFSDFFNVDKLQSLLYFPLDCPTALLYLHFNNITPFTVFADSFETNEAYDVWKNAFPDQMIIFKCIINVLKQTAELSKRNKSFEPLIKQFVLSKLEKESLISILKGLDLLGKSDQILTCDDLSQRISEVEAFLSTYDWKTDPDHPFSFQRRLEASVDYYKNFPKDQVIQLIIEGIQNMAEGSEPHAMGKEILKRL
jgi:hypothetical protein